MPDTNPAGSLLAVSAVEMTDAIWAEAARHPAAAPSGLPALLALEGTAFIEAAYEAVLGRAVDAVGLANLTAELATGRSKVDLLADLHRSPEGQRTNRPIAGLQSRFIARRFYRVPVLGRLARAGARLLRPARPAVSADTTLRAEIAARLGAYEHAIDTWRRAIEARMHEVQIAADIGTRRLAVMQAAQDAFSRSVLATQAEQQDRLSGLGERSAGFARQIAAAEHGLTESVLAMADDVASHGRRLNGVERGIAQGDVEARIEAAAGALRAELDARVIVAEASARQTRQIVHDQQRRIGLMLNALRDRVPAAVQAEDDHALDGLYLQFEDRFRGSRADIKQRQRVYLPRLRERGLGTADRPVLDIGAGRGEFLELLRDEGLAARGVDLNGAMVAACLEAGLDCVEGDALGHLAAQPAGSLGAITGFHIVEHIPFKLVVRLLDEALRVLVPGGLVIFETPNPANILTASRYFYLDPTHRNPLPGEMMAMIAEARGFADPEIVALHPMEARFPGTDRLLASALDGIFHGPQDYALIARRPLDPL